jgi:GNAT superfamily N-acetyltransferase
MIMTTGFTIIRASVQQIDQIAPLFDGYRQFYGQPADLKAGHRFLLERLTRDESVIFLALEGDLGLGFTQLFPSFSSVSMQRLWILNDLFVAPSARRRGVARGLLERAQQFARETQAKGLVLETAIDNPAQHMYEALGWERDDQFYHYSLRV